jgi:hypothetical protein
MIVDPSPDGLTAPAVLLVPCIGVSTPRAERLPTDNLLGSEIQTQLVGAIATMIPAVFLALGSCTFSEVAEDVPSGCKKPRSPAKAQRALVQAHLRTQLIENSEAFGWSTSRTSTLIP